MHNLSWFNSLCDKCWENLLLNYLSFESVQCMKLRTSLLKCFFFVRLNFVLIHANREIPFVLKCWLKTPHFYRSMKNSWVWIAEVLVRAVMRHPMRHPNYLSLVCLEIDNGAKSIFWIIQNFYTFGPFLKVCYGFQNLNIP